MPEKILIIEDEARMLRLLQLILETRGYHVETAVDGEDGILKWKTFEPDLVFTDLKMPKADGIEVLKYRNLKYPLTPLIILTAFGTIPEAVSAMKLGAFDYITKPVDNDIIIEKAKTALAGKSHAASLPGTLQPLLIGSSPAMAHVRKELELVSATNTSVLITGESGTGKELAARTIQMLSPRQGKPFVRINCAALPRELMEAELFGHTKGAFTGAVQARKGAFAAANSGILFLDEIGELPYELQSKLLHAVEDKVVTPVGTTEQLKIDIKIISATNQNIQKMIEQKQFRADLYFRLNTYKIHMPPLRDRVRDIPELTGHFLNVFSSEFNQKKPLICDQALDTLAGHTWPGNVRELKNVLERLVLVSKGGHITDDLVAGLILTDPPFDPVPETDGNTDLFFREKELIERTLIECEWNISKAARRLGITRNTLRYRIGKHSLNP